MLEILKGLRFLLLMNTHLNLDQSLFIKKKYPPNTRALDGTQQSTWMQSNLLSRANL